MTRAMKDSGVEWLGEIPEDWRITKLNKLTNCFDGKRVPIDKSLRNEGPYPYWGAGSITGYVDDYLFDEEIILLGEDGAPFFDKRRNVAHLIQEKVWVNNHIHVLKAKEGVSNAFMVHYLNIVDYGAYINGSILSKLTQGNMNKIVSLLPTLSEQKKIASFLDDKTAQIDSIINKTKESIEAFKVYKQALITQTVTKGLNPDVKMMASGTEWIGEIPEHWGLVRFGRLIISTMNGITRRNNTNENVGSVVLRLKDISNDGIVYDDVNRIELSSNEKDKYALKHGDLLFVRVNGSKHLVGKNTLFMGFSELVAFNDHIIKVTLSEMLLPSFTKWYLQSDSGGREVQKFIKTSAGQFTISGEDLRKVKISFPPLKEQKQIANFLDEKTAHIDSLIANKEKMVQELEAYKKAMIYEYVTGKKEVQ